MSLKVTRMLYVTTCPDDDMAPPKKRGSRGSGGRMTGYFLLKRDRVIFKSTRATKRLGGLLRSGLKTVMVDGIRYYCEIIGSNRCGVLGNTLTGSKSSVGMVPVAFAELQMP